MGRTGMCERGLLGRFGPNHAADPIVTRYVQSFVMRHYVLTALFLSSRWKRDADGNILTNAAGEYLLEFVAIKRVDNGEWAIPGVSLTPSYT